MDRPQPQEEEQPLVGPAPVKRGRGRPRKVPLAEAASRPGKAATTSKCSVRITASEREIAEAKEEEKTGRENGEDGDNNSKARVFKPPAPPRQSPLPPQVRVLAIPIFCDQNKNVKVTS